MPKVKQILLAIDAANHAIDAKDNGTQMDYKVSLTYAAGLGTVKQAGF